MLGRIWPLFDRWRTTKVYDKESKTERGTWNFDAIHNKTLVTPMTLIWHSNNSFNKQRNKQQQQKATTMNRFVRIAWTCTQIAGMAAVQMKETAKLKWGNKKKRRQFINYAQHCSKTVFVWLGILFITVSLATTCDMHLHGKNSISNEWDTIWWTNSAG